MMSEKRNNAIFPTKDRAKPRIWHSDFLVLTCMRDVLCNVLNTLQPVDKKNGVALEVGCGRAPYRRYIESMGFHYIGVDMYTTTGAQVVADGHNLSFLDESCDVVMHTCVLEHVPQPEEFLKECWRVVKPGGTLVFITHGCFPYHGTSEEYDDFWRWTHRGLRQLTQRCVGISANLIDVHAVDNDAVAILQLMGLWLRRLAQHWLTILLVGPVIMAANIVGLGVRRLDIFKSEHHPLIYIVIAKKTTIN